MSTDGIQVGDVVVLLDDDKDNYVTDFARYVGLAGEVLDVSDYGSHYGADVRVQFAEDDTSISQHIWIYDPDQLEVIGSVRAENK